jgi:hypothetical protein
VEVWCVRYGNYDPPEVDSLWVSDALAQRRADKLNDTPDSTGMWSAEYWGKVHDESSELLK